MTLIKSISGIRGTIGGAPGNGLTPLDVVKFTAAYSGWLREKCGKQKPVVAVGRDARISGEMVDRLVVGTLMGCGIDVIALGLATTPTVEVAVMHYKADGGLILTASHNPGQWNALKLLNSSGEFLTDADGKKVLEIAESGVFPFVEVGNLGKVISDKSFNKEHIEMVLAMRLVDREAIRQAKFKVVVDAVNSVGGVVIPDLLRELGVEVVELYCEPNGLFPHNPEPLPENLTAISAEVVKQKAHLGIVVDPDVDRLALVCEDGTMFGEEYTLVAVADYVLSKVKGNTVSNLSSSQALRDVTMSRDGCYFAAAVGEVNVVAAMKEHHAVIGGEGNGGVIYPELHYGRDALVGVALFLTLLAHKSVSCSKLRKSYPEYHMSKNKIQLPEGFDVDGLLLKAKTFFSDKKVMDIDGVKVDFGHEWVHMRKSNTEPIIRIYSESNTPENAEKIAVDAINVLKNLAGI